MNPWLVLSVEKHMKIKYIYKKEMDNLIQKSISDSIWEKASLRLKEIMEQYKDIPDGEHLHADNYIFPAAAVYLTLKEEIDERTAYDVVEKACMKKSLIVNKILSNLLKIPGMNSLFINLLDPLSRRMFGSKCGFENVFYPKKKGEFRMDITSCPYVRYFTALSCPELTKIFCANDERCYGKLEGIEFIRSGSLGNGDELCDFYMKKK